MTLEEFAEEFGYGFESYTEEQRENVLKAMRLILESCGLVELHSLAQILERLSDSAAECEALYEELCF